MQLLSPVVPKLVRGLKRFSILALTSYEAAGEKAFLFSNFEQNNTKRRWFFKWTVTLPVEFLKFGGGMYKA